MKKFIFLLGMGLFFLALNAFAEETIELKVSHFGPPTWNVQANTLEPWAKKIESLSGGRVKVTFFPKETLGKATEQYNLAVKGTADIAFGLNDYTPGRFPLSTVIKLPFLGVQSGEQSSILMWNLYQKYLRDEFKETHILWLACNGPADLHTVSKQVKTLEDLKGLTLRAPDPGIAKVVELLGAKAVVCPAPEGYQLMKEGKIDGAIIAWAGALDFKYLEICKYHTQIHMFTLPFFFTMNKAKYESLPPDIQKILDQNSGEEFAALTGKSMDNQDAKAKKIVQDRGDFIYTLPKAELERWKKITMTAGDQWVQEMKAKSLPGQEVLSYVVDLFIQMQK